MTYTNNIPVPTNPPASDVTNMQNNTAAVFTWTGVDHRQLNQPLQGAHNQVTFAGVTGGPLTPWTATGANTGPSQIFSNTFSTSEQLYYADNDTGRASISRLVPTAVCVGSATLVGANWTQNTTANDYNINCTVTSVGVGRFNVNITTQPIGWNYLVFLSADVPILTAVTPFAYLWRFIDNKTFAVSIGAGVVTGSSISWFVL